MVMLVRAALKHRVTVRRASESDEDGVPTYEWSQVAQGVPCLLTHVETQADQSKPKTAQADRVGTLLALTDNSIRPGDLIEFTCGPSGRFKVLPDEYRRFDLHGPSHVEFKVTEVPGR